MAVESGCALWRCGGWGSTTKASRSQWPRSICPSVSPSFRKASRLSRTISQGVVQAIRQNAVGIRHDGTIQAGWNHWPHRFGLHFHTVQYRPPPKKRNSLHAESPVPARSDEDSPSLDSDSGTVAHRDGGSAGFLILFFDLHANISTTTTLLACETLIGKHPEPSAYRGLAPDPYTRVWARYPHIFLYEGAINKDAASFSALRVPFSTNNLAL